MKRTIAIMLAVLTLAALMTGCSGRGSDNNVSTTPNGTVNGTNGDSGSQNKDQDTATNRPEAGSSGQSGSNQNGNGQNGSSQNGSGQNSSSQNSGDQNSAGSDDTASGENSLIGGMEDGLQDAVNDAGDMVQDAGDAIDDAMSGRSRQNGTGMIGGR